MSKKILVVDDERLIVKGIQFSLLQEHYEVECAFDGQEALEKAQSGNFDLILLDVMLPKLGGIEVCRTIRKSSRVPIIMLTAKGEDEDKIAGLEAGADDYVTKPFNINEVKARIRAIMRRCPVNEETMEENQLRCRGIHLDGNNRRAFLFEKELHLTFKEFDVLWLLASHPNQVYSREKLMELIWDYLYPGDLRTVDVHIRRLREKIEPNPGTPVYIMTKWGSGYYFNDHE